MTPPLMMNVSRNCLCPVRITTCSAAGLDPCVLDNPDAPAPAGGSGSNSMATGFVTDSGRVKICDDPVYAKFFKMLKMGVPRGAVENKMHAAGLDLVVLDNPDAPSPSIIAGGSDATSSTSLNAPKVSEIPKYSKFFKMLKMGVPRGAVEGKMRAAGLDPNVLNDPDARAVQGDTGDAISSQGALGAMLATRVESNAVGTPHRGGLPPSPLAPEAMPVEPSVPAVPQKKIIKPGVKMRGIFWGKLPVTQLEGTVWPELSDESISLNTGALEAQFGKRADDNLKKNNKTAPKASAVAHLIGSKRQQNVGIALARFRAVKGAAGIRSAVLRMDNAILDQERVQVLLKLAPSAEETGILSAYEGDIAKLGPEDRFLLELTKVPRLVVRLKSMSLRHTFDSTIDVIRGKIQMLEEAGVEVEKSLKLRKLLEVVLAVGNYVNGSTPRGGAWGFKLDTLAKLDTVKSNDGKHTLPVW